MRELLRDMPAGLPADSLLTRIKGRRSFLVRDWDRLLLARPPLVTLAPAPWRPGPTGAAGWAARALQQEYFWAFSRMDEELRCATAPFFWLAEVRTLAISLRLLAKDAADLPRLLQASLLANAIKKTLQKAGSITAAVAGLAALLAGYDPRFAKLGEIYRNDGPGALETALYEISLLGMTRRPLRPQMRCYLALLIDSRNLTTIAKRLRWRLDTLPPLLDGGHLPLPRLVELFKRRDHAGLLHLTMRLGGQAPYSESADLEQVLYEAQRRVMRRLAREADGIGVILDYLWRCNNEATNLGLLERLKTAGSEAVGAELRR